VLLEALLVVEQVASPALEVQTALQLEVQKVVLTALQ